MSEEINKKEAPAKEPETIEGWLRGRLDEMANTDPVFAEKLDAPNKSVEECLKYIQGEVYHKYIQGKQHGSSAVGMPSREEVFGWAVHYYDEEKVEIRKLPAGTAVSAEAPKLSKAELEKLKKQAEENALKRYEEEERKKIQEREKARKKAEAEKKKAEREKKEAERKAAGEMSLFDLMSL